MLKFQIEDSIELEELKHPISVSLNLIRMDLKRDTDYIKKHCLSAVHYEIWLEANYEFEPEIEFRNYYHPHKGLQMIDKNMGVQNEALHIHLDYIYYTGEFVVFNQKRRIIVPFKTCRLENSYSSHVLIDHLLKENGVKE